MGISRPIVSEIAYRTYAINEFGMATCFLLEGTERGLLIDTGCGMYNIREIAFDRWGSNMLVERTASTPSATPASSATAHRISVRRR